MPILSSRCVIWQSCVVAVDLACLLWRLVNRCSGRVCTISTKSAALTKSDHQMADDGGSVYRVSSPRMIEEKLSDIAHQGRRHPGWTMCSPPEKRNRQVAPVSRTTCRCSMTLVSLLFSSRTYSSDISPRTAQPAVLAAELRGQ